MRTTLNWMQIAVITSVVALNGPALAADAGQTTSQIQGTPPPAMSRSTGTTAKSVGGSERMDNSSPGGMDAWMTDHAAAHNGRVTRKEFLDQMGNRWDMMDAQRRGYLTPEQARGIYGSGPTLSGSDAKAK